MNALRDSAGYVSHDGDEAHGNRSLWLVTFIDLTALLIAFMVMLFSMSDLDPSRWRALTGKAAEPPQRPAAEVALVRTPDSEGLEAVVGLPGIDLDYLAGVLRRGLAESGPFGAAAVQRQTDRLVISLPNRLLFAPGGTGLDGEGRRAAAGLADMLGRIDNRIEIVGHADPTPPQAGFASNWELSLARALAVAALVEDAGYGRRIVVRGLGDARFAALAPDRSEGGRRALARRVDIVIHADAGESVE